MVKTTVRALTIAIVVIAEASRVVAQAPPTLDDANAHLAAASRAMQQFDASRAPADLRPAIDELTAASNTQVFRRLSAGAFVTQRRTLVAAWAEVLKRIQQSYDPAYDPHSRANWLVWGLPVPEYVHDPQERAAVVAAIKANDEKAKRAGAWHDVMVVDVLAQAILRVVLSQLHKVAPDGAGDDFAALDAILRRAGLSDATRENIDGCTDPFSAPC